MEEKKERTGMKTEALWPEGPYKGYNNESASEGREDPQVSLDSPRFALPPPPRSTRFFLGGLAKDTQKGEM